MNPLRYIAEVARCGSIREAADNLHVAASAISRHIRNAEYELGAALFDRTPRGVKCTAAGNLYVDYARSVLAGRDRVRTDIENLNELRRGHVKIHTIDGIVGGPLSSCILDFQKMYPGVRFEIASLGTDDITAAVLAGDADVGITFQATPTPNIQVVTRIVDPLLAIVAPEHPLSQLKSIDFRDVLAFPMALPGRAFGIRKVIDAFCTVEGIALQPSLETNSIEGLRGFARAGIGVSALHYLGISRDIDQGSVIGIPFSNAPLRKSLVEICVLNGRQLPIAAERFIEHLRRELSKKRKA